MTIVITFLRSGNWRSFLEIYIFTTQCRVEIPIVIANHHTLFYHQQKIKNP